MRELLALCLIVLALSACRDLRASVYVEELPPDPPLILRPNCPGDDFEWVSGHYSYVGEAWVWAEGAWVVRPRPKAYWVPGRWVQHGRGYVYVGGHWRS